jgi:hypothetical protein
MYITKEQALRAAQKIQQLLDVEVSTPWRIASRTWRRMAEKLKP